MTGSEGRIGSHFSLAGFITLIMVTFGCGHLVERDRSVDVGIVIADSIRVGLGFDFIRRNSGTLVDDGRTYFYFADLESAKHLVLCDSALREVRRIDLGWLHDEYGELAGIAPEDTSTFWVLTKYSNTLLQCAADTVLVEQKITRSGLALNWADELERSNLMTTSGGLSLAKGGDVVLRVDWAVPLSCPAGETNCCYFDSIRYRPLAVHVRTGEAGARTLTYTLDSFFHRMVPTEEVHFLADALGFTRWGDQFAAFSSWSDRVLVGQLDDPRSVRSITVHSEFTTCGVKPIPCKNIGDGEVLNQRLRTEGHIGQIDWLPEQQAYCVLVMHGRPDEEAAQPWDFSVIKFDQSWNRVSETPFFGSVYDPSRI
ncbi:MAG: hypothetical protein IT229_06185, partial [Flavobacteriales bacterium]|nr:hypothetical protein [Flavobacteriales bacterium]